MKKYHDIQKVEFQGSKLVVHVDGHCVEKELSTLSERLLHASAEERKRFEISPSGYGIHWPLIDEDLSIDGLLGIAHTPETQKKSA